MSKSYKRTTIRDLCRVSRHTSIKAARAAWNRAERHADRVRLNNFNWEEEDTPEAPRKVNPWDLPGDGRTWDPEDDLRK